MQKRLITVLATVAMLTLSAPLAAAKPGNGNGNGPQGTPNHGSSEAAKLCAEQKQADKAAFKALWGKHAMRDCIRAGRAEDEVATAAAGGDPERRAGVPRRARRRPGRVRGHLRHERQRSQRVRQVRLDEGPRGRGGHRPHDGAHR